MIRAPAHGGGPRELLHGLSVAKGSLDEVHDRLDSVAELRLVDESLLSEAYTIIDDLSRQLTALSRDLRRRYGK